MVKSKCSIFIIWAALLLSGCTTTTIKHSPTINLAGSSVGIAPFDNATETPLADVAAVNITQNLLRVKKVRAITYPMQTKPSLLPGVPQAVSNQQIIAWAKNNNLQYVLQGVVNEWRYKVGLDGEPAIGLSLTVVDINNNAVVWNAVGSKSGGSRTALTTTAQQLLNNLLDSLAK